jgi:hypothetical protein
MTMTSGQSNRPISQLGETEFRLIMQALQGNAYPMGWGMPKLFGNGSDGIVTLGAGTTNLTSHIVKQYKSLVVPVGATLSTNATSEAALLIWVQEKCLIAGTIDLTGKGGLGGAAVAYAAGNNGTDYATAYGGSGGGGGGLTGWPAGSRGGNSVVLGGTGGLGGGLGTGGNPGNSLGNVHISDLQINPAARGYVNRSWGTGGGSGCSTSGPTGNGGNGGGALVLVARDLTITGTIRTDGALGSNGSASDAGGGGGGGGLILLVCVGYSNSGTLSSAGVSGGGGNTNGAYGGAGPVVIIRV